MRKFLIVQFILAVIAFCLGAAAGKAYSLKYMDIRPTDTGYVVELDYKEYVYEYETVQPE